VHGLLSGGCGDLIAEREFPSDKVYRRDDRGIVGVESLSLQGLAFFDIHTSVRREAWPDGSSWPSPMLAGQWEARLSIDENIVSVESAVRSSATRDAKWLCAPAAFSPFHARRAGQWRRGGRSVACGAARPGIPSISSPAAAKVLGALLEKLRSASAQGRPGVGARSPAAVWRWCGR
jgi:hypothetical protein